MAKSKSKDELAREYGITVKTLANWLSAETHKIAFKNMNVSLSAKILPPIAVEYIYKVLGEP